MLGYAGWYGKDLYREFLFFVPFQQLFLIGPVFFFYVKSLLNESLQYSQKDVIHFLPAVAYLIYSLVVVISDVLILDDYYFYADGRDKDLDFWYQMAGLISMLFYLFKSLRYYYSYRKISLQEVSYAEDIAHKWIEHFTIAFGLILLLRVLFFIINPEWGEFGSKYWYYLSFSVLLLYISITGYSNTIRTTLTLDPALLMDLQPVVKVQDILNHENPEEALVIREWKDKIIRLFEDRELYKKPDLTLTDIAMFLETNRNIISRVINQEFNMNLNDFVNEMRTKAVITKLEKGEHIHSTLLGIAMECGFNSKTTFNRAFKKHTGKTPKQFIIKNKL